jgi:hypothetical protein
MPFNINRILVGSRPDSRCYMALLDVGASDWRSKKKAKIRRKRSFSVRFDLKWSY